MEQLLSLDQLNEEMLRTAGVQDTAAGLRFVRELAGMGISDDDLAPLLSPLLQALASSPDADQALSSFARWFAGIGGRYAYLQYLLGHPVALSLFCLITGSSGWFADLLVRQPEAFEIIANPGARDEVKTSAELYRSLSSLINAIQRPELKRDALRRWKAREMLRIGVRDLAGLSDMPTTALEFSNLADTCVQAALEISLTMHPLNESSRGATLPFCVIGMGKLGGRELNYSSDIDLIFVHGDHLPEHVNLETGRKLESSAYLTRIAETLVKVLNEESANGHVFRVDMRLRPEGRFGPLTRSLSSCAAYYESWAETWERQALLKARFIAGDRPLGDDFLNLAEGFVYRKHISVELIEDIRHNKRRIESKCSLEGQWETNIKVGYGGIRNIEFLVQLLQLELGGAASRLRVTGTLSALTRLQQEGFLTVTEAQELREDYIFLRTLEHRLQLQHGFQTQTLPAPGDPERRKLARRMGFADPEQFELELQRRRDRNQLHLNQLFYRESGNTSLRRREAAGWEGLSDLLDAIDNPVARERLSEMLAKAGFRNLPAALLALQLPMRGNEFGGMPPDTPVLFKQIAEELLSLLAETPDPDAGLAGLESLALAMPDRARLYKSLSESPDALRRLIRLAACSPHLFTRFVHHLEWLEALLNPEEDEIEDLGYMELLHDRLRTCRTEKEALDAMARVYQRESLKIGAADIWNECRTVDIMDRLTRLAEAMLSSLLKICGEAIIKTTSDPEFARQVLDRVAIIGLGKLGGAEPGYSSDWDVIFVYDEEHKKGEAARSSERFDIVNPLVQHILAAGRELVTRGAEIEIDLRLRPWGKKGALIQTPHSFAAYYRTEAETWERQSALKARFLAGNSFVGHRFERLMHAVSYGHGLNSEENEAIRAMKMRIENERLKPGEAERDLKLGHGGLTDIEWLAQRLQLRYGGKRIAVRAPGTLKALSGLASIGAISNAEADALSRSYRMLARVRNAFWLQMGQSVDVPQEDPTRHLSIGKMMGYAVTDQAPETTLWPELRAMMSEVRAIYKRRFQDE